MFNVTKEQRASLKEFIEKLPSGIGRGNVKTWSENAIVNESITQTELDKLKGFKPHLVAELAQFVDGWVKWVTERERVEKEEFKAKTPEKSKSKLGENVAESLKNYKKPDEKETGKPVSADHTSKTLHAEKPSGVSDEAWKEVNREAEVAKKVADDQANARKEHTEKKEVAEAKKDVETARQATKSDAFKREEVAQMKKPVLKK